MAQSGTNGGERAARQWWGWPLLALVVAAAMLLWPTLAGDRALLPGEFLYQFEPWHSELGERAPAHWNALQWDALAQYYPWRLFAARTLHGGHLPLWNPHQFCGAPFLANGQSSVLYPPNLLFWLMPVWRAFAWVAFLHLLLAGGGMYALLRALERSRAAATLGALAFMLSGFFATWLEMTTLVAVGAWLPLALFLVERFFQRRQARWAVGLGAALGVASLAGHPQMVFYLFLGTGAFFIYRACCLGREAGWRHAAAITATGGLGALGLALLLAGGQLLPTAEYVLYSHRMPGGYDAYVRYALPWQQALAVALPDFFGRPSLGTYWGQGNYAEYASYVGILPLLLIGLAAWCGRGRHFWFFAGLAGFSVLIALGTPLNAPLYHLVPGLKGSGGPARILYLWAFAATALAAHGFDGMRERAAKGGMRRAPALVGLGLAGLAALGTVGVWQGTPNLVSLGLGEVARDSTHNWLVLVAVCLALPLALLAARRRPGLLAPALVVLLAADLLLFAHGYNPTVHHLDLYPKTPLLCALPTPQQGRTLGLYRRWPLDRFPQAALPPNWAMVYGTEDALGYDSIYPARYKALLTALLGGRDPSPPANGNMLLAGQVPAASGILDVVATLSPGPADAPTRPDGLRGRVWWTPTPTIVAGAGEAYASLSRDPFTPVLEGGGPQAGMPARPLVAPWRRPDPNRMAVTVTTPGRGWLLISEQQFPGWQARLNGRLVPLRTADLALRALPVPAGRVSIEMEYRPGSVRLGLFATLLGTSLLAGSLGWWVQGRRRRERSHA